MTLRNTMLTVSVRPVSARQPNITQNECDAPKATVASPYPATAHSSTSPRRSMRSTRRTMAVLATRAPTDGAA